ncbi:MAG: hypothetical protein ACRD17_10020 [Terriglobales bacterium]
MMADLKVLNDAEEKELWRLLRFYRREAGRCRRARAHLAGCVMLGAALETLLVLMVNASEEEALATGLAPKKGRSQKPLLEWGLSEMLRVAAAAGWMPATFQNAAKEWNHKTASIGDYATLARKIRNLVHPRQVLEGYYRCRSTEGLFKAQLRIFNACRRALSSANAKSLREALDREATTARARRPTRTDRA